MPHTLKKIVFFGTEEFSLTALTGLIEGGYEIAAVVTKPDSKRNRGQQLQPPEVKVLASSHNIPVWQPDRLVDIHDNIVALGQVCGVLVSYGKIIPESIINLFTPGIVNVHPSLLPLYRGPSPIESAIRNGDMETGISIMQLARRMDAGPIYTVKKYPLTGTENRPELYHTLSVLGTSTLLEALPKIIEGTLTPSPQDETRAVYCDLLRKSDTYLNPKIISAVAAERTVRAHLLFPKTKYSIMGHEIIITKSHVSNKKETPLDIECQDGAYLSVDELITPNGRRTTGESFLRGYKG